MLTGRGHGWFLAGLLACASFVHAAEPVDPELIPEARAVLKYLESVYGTKTLTAAWGGSNAAWVLETTGREPALVAFDLTGWNSPTWGKTYTPVVEHSIDYARAWWAKGGIVSFQFHWKNPLRPDGSAWVAPPKGTGPVDLGQAIKPGTKEHAALMEDLRKHADYLQKLADARVPVLWRPFHEIDGGWFWWTDKEKPENTAALWRQMFDYLVKERKLHNLIWVYSAGVHPGGLKQKIRLDNPNDPRREPTLDDEIAFRKRYYPGDPYVDVAGIDIYPNPGQGYGQPSEDTYPKAFKIMDQIAPARMHAMCESGFVLSADLIARSGPKWLYSLQWFEGDAAYDRLCYNHPVMITLDQLPVIVARPVPPNVRITAPADGAAAAGGAVELRAEAVAHHTTVAKVEFRRLPGPWENWFLARDEDKAAALEKSELIGESVAAPYAFTWKNAPAGLHNVIARVTDAKGAAATSNTVRISVGLKNLALGKTVTASSSNKNSPPPGAVDGNLFTQWSSEKSDPQWISVDLGSEQAVGGVVLLWTKANGKAFTIQTSSDNRQWKDVYTEAKGRPGATVAAFPPAKVRYVRMNGTKRGTEWGGYSLYEFGVYESMPEAR
ncbi:MAG: discoidin domain-containing protein [Acidobacteria bacterium]|nr:discoidin domain-containing protein [Planctomycetota bacterium]MBE3131866.1 discoidin domain-containing protein [Acidobacteriota bacterium]